MRRLEDGSQDFVGVKGNFVQIIHVRGNHWITVSNINCSSKTIYIYDSMYADVDRNTQRKICSIWRPQWQYVKFKW